MSIDSFNIGDRLVGLNAKPFIIAEMSGNHNQSLDRALAIVDAAAEAGADAVKLQTYTADTMTIDVDAEDFHISDKNSLWYGKYLYELYHEAHTPWDWHKPIVDRCKEKGLLCLSTPFDDTAVDFLETLDMPCYKVASFENTDIHLLKKVAGTGKPIIVSTGMASLSELELIVQTLRDARCKNFVLLKCTSSYPATPENSNILTIPHLREMFDCHVGLSDHTLGVGVAVASVALGVRVIEKHFTLSRAEGGVDATFSLEPSELKSLVEESERAWLGLGEVSYGATETEVNSLAFRRSIYVVDAMAEGDIVTEKNVRCIRPGFGLPPKYLNNILGKRIKKAAKRGTRFSWDLIS